MGKVFRAEALHACGIAYAAGGQRVGRAAPAALGRAQGDDVAGVEDGRIITVDPPDRLALAENAWRRVYKRDTCYDCGTPIVVADLAGRTSYTCPRCQPD